MLIIDQLGQIAWWLATGLIFIGPGLFAIWLVAVMIGSKRPAVVGGENAFWFLVAMGSKIWNAVGWSIALWLIGSMMLGVSQ
jgi:hypothetical protein